VIVEAVGPILTVLQLGLGVPANLFRASL